MKVINVVGARPNFMKIAPIVKAMAQAGGFDQMLVHTGQHYDDAMSGVFFNDLGIPAPDVHLNVGPGTHAQQTAKVMLAFEPVVMDAKPDVVVVVGDVNSTMAAAVVCAKLCVPCAHVEAGLRSDDRTMPEEINRVITDAVCDFLLTPSRDANDNLCREGIPKDRICLVGNVMIDTLLSSLQRAEESDVLRRLGLDGAYALLTLHRPSNVDDGDALKRILDALEVVQRQLRIVFPIHPRTTNSLEKFGLVERLTNMTGIALTPPLGYLDCLKLTAHAKLVLTDSGGLQEETTALGVPCLTLRENTERPVTVTEGTNTLVGNDTAAIVSAAQEILSNGGKRGRIPELWDGNAAERIVEALARRYGS